MINKLFPQNLTVYDVMCDNAVQPDTPLIAIWRVRALCWLIKLTGTLSEYIILIAFPLQQWIRESASLLHCTYIACLVYQVTTLTHSFVA